MSVLRFLLVGSCFCGLLAIYACADRESFGSGDSDTTADAGKTDGASTVFTEGGVNPLQDSGPPFQFPPSSIAFGEDFACVVGKDRTVSCWGRNDYGQIGSDPATTPSTATPTKVAGVDHVQYVVAGKDFACALAENQKVWCWGNNAKKQIAGHGVAARFTPDIAAENAAQVTASGEHACILDNDGFVHCWGDNTCNIFGGTTGGQFDSVTLSTPQLSQISIGDDAMCAVTVPGQILCWGADHHGSLGHAPSAGTTCNGFPSDPDLKRVLGDGSALSFEGATDVHLGYGVACARKNDATVYCWGDNAHGALGQGIADTDTHVRPVSIPAIQTNTLEVKGQTACAITADRLICWGDAHYGQLDSIGSDAGCGGEGCRPWGYVEPGQTSVRSIAVGVSNLATIKHDLTAWVWGRNDYGEVGVPKTDSANVSCAGGASSCVPSPRQLTTVPPLE